MTAKPRTWSEHPSLSPLEALPSVRIPVTSLRPGMVLLDPDFMTPCASIDHKTRTVRGSGNASFLAFDYDTRSYETVALFANSSVWVAAA